MADERVVTKDGSVTFRSSSYDETYHSVSGALEEADKKYSKVCGIGARESVDILDICFGLGYNSAAALDDFRGSRIRIVGLESYQGIVDEIVRLGEEYPFSCRDIMQKVAKDGRYCNAAPPSLYSGFATQATASANAPAAARSAGTDGLGGAASFEVSVSLMMGDARETIKKLGDSSFDVVFLDPFSPAKCPELWTAEFFGEIYRVLRSGGVVATYSCARVVRENFRKARFDVTDGPVVGRRGPGTIAKKG
ncbi:tRNA (5-methylaminomethyl-2-thiouridine)(34)-methyltransferase MnmD [Nanoarchaeota archaeon]